MVIDLNELMLIVTIGAMSTERLVWPPNESHMACAMGTIYVVNAE